MIQIKPLPAGGLKSRTRRPEEKEDAAQHREDSCRLEADIEKCGYVIFFSQHASILSRQGNPGYFMPAAIQP